MQHVEIGIIPPFGTDPTCKIHADSSYCSWLCP